MAEEREDTTQENFGDQPASGDPGSQNAEEQPTTGSPTGSSLRPEEKGTTPTVEESDDAEEPGSSPGAAGEGTQSTGNPLNAG